MKTGNIEFKRAIYKISKMNKDSRIYEIDSNLELDDESLHTKLIKVERFNGFQVPGRFFKIYMYFRSDSNWHRCKKTGLAFTANKNIFEGNISRVVELQKKTSKGKDFETPQHLVIVEFINDSQLLIVDIFKNFYPFGRSLLNSFLQEHNYYLSLIKKGA